MRVLIVEDNADAAESLANALVALNPSYDVVWAASLGDGEAAVCRKRPDVALVDLALPDADGCEAVVALQAVAPDLPLVALTGRDFDSVALELTRLGVQDYLQKGSTSIQRIDQVLQLAVERQQHEVTWRMRACYDPVTGVFTRYGIETQLRKAMSHASRSATLGALLVFDLDDFKSINDAHGHKTGDAVLHEIAQRVTAVARRGDSLGRLGGDEFALVLEGLKSREDAAVVARKAIKAASVPLRTRENLTVSISLGISLFPDEFTDAKTLIDSADRAMYEAKSNGKNSFCFSEPSDTRGSGEHAAVPTIRAVRTTKPATSSFGRNRAPSSASADVSRPAPARASSRRDDTR